MSFKRLIKDFSKNEKIASSHLICCLERFAKNNENDNNYEFCK